MTEATMTNEQEGQSSRCNVMTKNLRPNCMHTAHNSTYLVRAAAVCTKGKKKKYVIWDAASFSGYNQWIDDFLCQH